MKTEYDEKIEALQKQIEELQKKRGEAEEKWDEAFVLAHGVTHGLYFMEGRNEVWEEFKELAREAVRCEQEAECADE